jgi:hypothetical protein
MSIDELEAAALRLEPKDRARLAERLLDSLEALSPEENDRLWAEEAQRRADAVEAGVLSSRLADDVFRDARSRL